MYRYFISFFCFIFFIIVLTPVHASRRIALVIGNASYHSARLLNPINDANDMKTVLTNLGFKVILKHDLHGKKAMVNAVREFTDSLFGNDIGLFYFSGHGQQAEGSNYLKPIGANYKTEADIGYEFFNVKRVLELMNENNTNGVNIVILDACRSDSFYSGGRSIQGGGKGLTKIKIDESPKGTLIAYATAPGGVANTSTERNSIYTKHLLGALRNHAHLSVLDLLTEVTRQVDAETKGRQVPWKEDSLTQRFCFRTCGEAKLLRECEGHFKGNRLTKAWACYEEVLRKDRGNIEALDGLKSTEARYVIWIKQALKTGQRNRAWQHLESLQQANPESPMLLKLKEILIQSEPSQGSSQRCSGYGYLKPKMEHLPAGSFKMGDIQKVGYDNEQPVHEVKVNRFAIGRYEVTFAEYDCFAEATGRTKPDDEGWGRGNRPVINVYWHDATAYAKWLSQKTGQIYRLPTEAEWEYAARSTTETKYWWGTTAFHRNANYGENQCCDGLVEGKDRWKYTSPVGSFAPNFFGLYDTVGNVLEWVCSEYEANYRGKEQRCTTKLYNSVVVRGGSWFESPRNVRAAYRDRSHPTIRRDDLGFRLVKLVKE